MRSLKEKLKQGLKRTHATITDKIKSIFVKNESIDEMYDEIEEVLIKADVGIKTTMELIEYLKSKKAKTENVYDLLKEKLSDLLPAEAHDIKEKKVILVLGVNGSGKTTSITKLASLYKNEGKRVVVAAGDTFRAGAIDQLEIWANRVGVHLVKQHDGADPSSVVYDAISALLSKEDDVLIVDTAGRLHTNVNLIEELKKIKRTITKRIEEDKIETIMILDSNTGNNSIEQAKIFSKELEVNSIFLAKIDSSAKGGFIFSIAKELNIPVRYLGVGEKAEDVLDFSKQEFISALFD